MKSLHPRSLPGRILFSFVVAVFVGLAVGFLLGDSLRRTLLTALGVGVGMAIAEAMVGFSERRS